MEEPKMSSVGVADVNNDLRTKELHRDETEAEAEDPLLEAEAQRYVDHRSRRKLSRIGSTSTWMAVLSALCVVLAVLNVAQFVQSQKQQEHSVQSGYTGVYANGGRWRQYSTWSDFSSEDEQVEAAAWSTFQTTGFVAVPHEWAAQQQLPTAMDWPDDGSKGVYVLDGFHQLHCVIYLREQISHLMKGRSIEKHFYHVQHCYDYLRQSIQCRADDTPMYIALQNNLTAGDGQLRWCRDWGALERWASERTACWPTGSCKSSSEHEGNP